MLQVRSVSRFGALLLCLWAARFAGAQTTGFDIFVEPYYRMNPAALEYHPSNANGVFYPNVYSRNDGNAQTLYLSYLNSDYYQNWNLIVDNSAIPGDLAPGYYKNAVNIQANALPGQAVFDLSGPYGGTSGAFHIVEAAYDYTDPANIKIVRFAARFVEHSNGNPQAMRGVIRYQSSADVTDVTPPVTTATITDNLIQFSAADPDSPDDIDGTYYQIDGGDVRLYAAAFLVLGAPGTTHTLTYWSKDIAGNQEPPRTASITLSGSDFASRLTLHSDAGDVIGGGKDYVFDNSAGAFTARAFAKVHPGQSDVAGVTYTDAKNSGLIWYASFATSQIPAPLVPGTYRNIRADDGYGTPGFANLAVNPYNVNSPSDTGAFQILEAAYDYSTPQPTVVRFAARFSQHANGAIPALHGMLLYNSRAQFVDQGSPATAVTVTNNQITLTPSDPDGPDDIDVTYYQIDHGPVRAYSGPIPVLGAIGSAHTLTVWSEDIAGNQEAPRDIAFVIQGTAPISLLALRQTSYGSFFPGGPPYPDTDSYFDSNTGSFFAYAYDYDHTGGASEAEFAYKDRFFNINSFYKLLLFDARRSVGALTPGYYTMTEAAPVRDAGRSGLSFYAAPYRGGGSGPFSGAFQILDAQFDYSSGTPKVVSYAARFVQHSVGYDGVPSLSATYGTFLYQSSFALPPDTTPPVTTATITENTVTLSASDPDSPADFDATYYQLDGSDVRLYTAPVTLSGFIGTAHTITFWSRDIAGNKETPQTRSLVIDAAAPVSLLYMRSDKGDYIGASRNWYYDSNTAIFSAGAGAPLNGAPTSVGVSVTTASFGSAWSLQFTTTQLGPPIGVGFYNNAQRASFAAPGVPGLEVSGLGRGSNTLTGNFTVFDYAVDSSGAYPRLLRFAALFEQHDAGNPPALRGLIRYNSSAPLPALAAPTTTATLTGTAGLNGWYRSPVTVALAAQTVYTPYAITQTNYAVNGGPAEAYTAPFVLNAEGRVNLSYGSVDAGGDVEAMKSLVVPIDMTPPALTAQLKVGLSAGATVSVTVSGQISDAISGFDPKKMTYQYVEESLNVRSAGSVTVQKNGAYSLSLNLIAPSKAHKQLKYRIAITGQDMAGNLITKTLVVPLSLETIRM